MKKYDYQTCIRMSSNLKDSMTEICDTYQINESDYIRKSLMQSIQEDLKNTQNADAKFLFVWLSAFPSQ